ncbi:MAG: ABC transporter permease [Treponema sp.]|nr:ABC transporter permease [Treponema sp.]
MSYILRRVIVALITLFLVSILCFLAFSVIKGDPAVFSANVNTSPEQLETLREEMGLNRNVFIRYFDWLFNLLRGNPGSSMRYHGEAISTMISHRIPVSFSLAILSLLFILIISVPLSLLTVKREGSLLDRIINFLTAAGISAPGFFIGILFIFLFGFMLKIFIPGEYIDYRENFFGFLGCLFFPALAIAIPNAAVLTKFLRGSLFSELQSDYVRTARSKGANSFYTLCRHVLKNAAIPAITVFGMIIAEVLSGSVVIEQVFSVPGIGRLLIGAISSRDYPLIQALMVYIAFVVVSANTLADIVIMIIDPRIRPSKRAIQ